MKTKENYPLAKNILQLALFVLLVFISFLLVREIKEISTTKFFSEIAISIICTIAIVIVDRSQIIKRRTAIIAIIGSIITLTLIIITMIKFFL